MAAVSLCARVASSRGRFSAWLVPAGLRWSSSGPKEGAAEAAAAAAASNVVRLPHAWRRRLAQGAARKGRREAGAVEKRLLPHNTGRLLLLSRRQELSQAARHTVGRWEKPRLVSAGWKHRQARGDFFQLQRMRQEPPREEKKEARHGPSAATAATSFLDLGVEPELLSVLQEVLGITHPTPVQRRIIPTLLGGSNALCAGETGSGKTLAYLLPLIQRLCQHLRDSPVSGNLSTAMESPRSLVLLPSRELAGQVRSVASRLCTPLGFQVKEIGSGRGLRSVRRKIQAGPTDLLVSTPGILSTALRRKVLTLEKVHCLVLDEVDTLLDPTFVDLVQYVLEHMPLATNSKETVDEWDPKTQVVAVGATLPKGVYELLSKAADMESFRILRSYNLHYLQSHVQQKFLCLKGSEKVTELVQLLKERKPSSGAVLVFCNTASTVNWLGYILDDHKIKHERLQGQMESAVRASIFWAFQNNQFDVLVCTDIASRGLDTVHVELVINYDFPRTLPDYLHRAGRVGRVGSKFPGTVVSFVTHKWDVDLVRKIETAARKRSPLPGMEPIDRQPV